MDAAGESWESVFFLQAELESRPLTPTAPEVGVLAESGGGDSGARKKSCSYGASPSPSVGGGNAMAPGEQASGRRSSSGCMKPESRAIHTVIKIIRPLP